jgi:hypothetical protein
MRFLLPAIGIAVLVVVGTALQVHFAPKRVAEAGVMLGAPSDPLLGVGVRGAIALASKTSRRRTAQGDGGRS